MPESVTIYSVACPKCSLGFTTSDEKETKTCKECGGDLVIRGEFQETKL